MKLFKQLIYFSILVLLASCGNKDNQGIPADGINPDVMKNPATAAADPNDNSKVPVMEFEKDTHDFGTITQGEKIQYAFRFKNTGNGDLVIRSANGSCGCTVPEWPKDPIPPGGDGVVNITFDSEGKHGMQNKKVTIISNTVPNTKELNITGEVLNADGAKQENTNPEK